MSLGSSFLGVLRALASHKLLLLFGAAAVYSGGLVFFGNEVGLWHRSATKTTIYYRGGQGGAQNKSDAAYVAQTYFNGATVKKLDPSLESLVPATASIVVLVGADVAQSLVA